MKKATSVIIALLALAYVGSANASMLGFDVMGTFYNPRDTRWTGIGADVAANLKLSNDFTIGYRISELNVKGSDASQGAVAAAAGAAGTGTALAAATTPNVTVNSQITFQGIQGWWTFARAMEDKVAGDFGLWMGYANTANFPTSSPNTGGGAAGTNAAVATAGLSSPFVEPQLRVNYISKGSAVDAKLSVGFGYRFVRNWNVATPFFASAGAAPAAGSSRALTDFDGMDFNLGVGLMF